MNNIKSHLTFTLMLLAFLLMLITDFFPAFFLSIWIPAILFLLFSYLNGVTRKKEDKRDIKNLKLNMLYTAVLLVFYFAAAAVLHALGGSPQNATGFFNIILIILGSGSIFYHYFYYRKEMKARALYGEYFDSPR
ncbi:hypothetical protein [Alkalicoccus daliensis]|uniref:Uncharacterized protein n=1 Tax=Alkalicoccus daliensis TaxID=745820 RepID=A0A1H0D528_9BACI|nr:hypothetical protein [Alkalicoccus daliensis]SDN65248.1 hypothetical protein SAMN04488053_102346 [Alkalicoccus daliensis]